MCLGIVSVSRETRSFVLRCIKVDSMKLIQPLEKPIYTSRWKIRKNMLSNLSFVISGN